MAHLDRTLGLARSLFIYHAIPLRHRNRQEAIDLAATRYTCRVQVDGNLCRQRRAAVGRCQSHHQLCGLLRIEAGRHIVLAQIGDQRFELQLLRIGR